MFYILTKPGEDPVYPYTLTDLIRDNPNVSFPRDMTNFDAAPWHCHLVQETTPPVVDYTENLDRGTPLLVDDAWIETWVTTPASSEDILTREATMRSDNKQQASTLLIETDYTDLPNTASKIINLDAILAYRDALRSIALNPPVKVEHWPIKPETEWRQDAI